MKTAKLLSAVFAAILVATTVSAQRAEDNPGKFSIHVGATALVFGGEPFGGVALSLGWQFTPKDLFMFEFNPGMGPSERIGSYSYITYTKGSSAESGTVHNDGKVSYDYNSFDTVISYSRLFTLSEKWKFRVGPAIGVTGIKAGDKYVDSFDGEVEGLPEPESIRQNVFVGGLLTGIRWDFAPRASLDLTYMLSGHAGMAFEARSISVFDDLVSIGRKEFGNMSHRFNLTVGFRIGKSKQ